MSSQIKLLKCILNVFFIANILNSYVHLMRKQLQFFLQTAILQLV